MFSYLFSRESTDHNQQQMRRIKQRTVNTLLKQHPIQQLELSQRPIPFLIQQLKEKLLNHHPFRIAGLQIQHHHQRIKNHLDQFQIKFKSIHVHMIFM